MNVAIGLQHLKHSTLFSDCSELECRSIGRFSKPVFLSHGQVLFREGELCSAIYVLRAGLVKLSVRGPGEHEKIIEFIEPGQTFAEAAMFSGQGYPVTASAIEDSELVAVEAYAMMRYLRGNPDLAWKMLASMSRRTHQLVAQIKSISLHTAEQKVASYFLDHYDPDLPDQPVGHLPTRRSDLASIIGITSETLCRVIASFRKKRWINTIENDIFIIELKALVEVVKRDECRKSRNSIAVEVH